MLQISYNDSHKTLSTYMVIWPIGMHTMIKKDKHNKIFALGGSSRMVARMHNENHPCQIPYVGVYFHATKCN